MTSNLCFRETVETDLEISETKLDEACANVEKEKKTRYISLEY